MATDLKKGWFCDHAPGRGKIMSAGLVGPLGKYYFEVKIVTTYDEAEAFIGIGGISFQLSNPTGFDVSPPPGATFANGVGWSFKAVGHAGVGWGYPNGPNVPNTLVGLNDVYGIAVDTVDHGVWIRNATRAPATWLGANMGAGPDPVTDTAGMLFGAGQTAPIVGNVYILCGGGHDSTAGANFASIVLNTGATSFVAAAPAGFVAWDLTATSTFNPLDKAAEITLSGGSLSMTTTTISGANQPTAFVRSNTSKAS